MPALKGLKILVVDAEDTFTAMIVQQLEALGPTAEVVRHDRLHGLDGFDAVVMGPVRATRGSQPIRRSRHLTGPSPDSSRTAARSSRCA